MSIYRLPPSEKILAEKPLGQDQLNRRISARVETCNGSFAFHERMLCFQDHDQQVVKECRYSVLERPMPITYYRVVILRGTGIEHTTRGDWKYADLGQHFRSEDLEPFASVNDALAYAQSWVRSHIAVQELAEAVAL